MKIRNLESRYSN